VRKILNSLALVALLWTPVVAAAQPTVQVAGGATLVDLDEGFVTALGDLGLTPGAIGPARLDLQRGTASFPIPRGALDLSSAAGDVFHSGGLSLTGPVEVQLLNFVIDTTASPPELTGLVVVDGAVVDRLPLFELDIPIGDDNPVLFFRFLLVRDVGVSLTGAAADALNGVFETEAFVEGFPIGEARVFTLVANPRGGPFVRD